MSTLLERGRAGECLSDLNIVDLHGHLGLYSFAYPDPAPPSIVKVMDRIGVAKVVCSHARTMSADTEWGNQETLKFMRAFPGRVLGYVILWPADAQTVRAATERWLDQGFTGIKLHNSTGFAYTESAYAPALEIANQRRLPVLLHTWGEESVFRQVDQLAGQYPEASFLLAHSGCCNEAGYIHAARLHGNVYLDLCLSLCPRGLVKRLADAVGADKIVWGSDCNFFAMTKQLGKVLGAEIPDSDKIKILATNAQRILGRAG